MIGNASDIFEAEFNGIRSNEYKWRATMVFDGVVYGLVTAGVFGWLWPDA